MYLFEGNATRLAQQAPAATVEKGCKERSTEMNASPTIMKLLETKVPLTLLLDLADAEPSRAILRRESGNAAWLTSHRPTAAAGR
jgi:hypothetical protein